MIPPSKREGIISELMQLKRDTNGCAISTRGCSEGKYPQIKIKTTSGRRQQHALHRVSYALFIGPIRENMVIMHTCDNRRCVEPTHLVQGTFAENSADMSRKGRAVSGTRHHSSKLSEDEVRSMRNDFNMGASKKSLSRKYGICRSAVKKVVELRTWKKVI